MLYELEPRKCIICGKEFKPKSGNQKICGSEECLKARRKEYAHNHIELYRELNRRHRQKPHVKAYRALYDKEYQIEHKEQIKAYKKMYWQKKQFFKYLNEGELLKNAYYYSLSKEEQQQYNEKVN